MGKSYGSTWGANKELNKYEARLCKKLREMSEKKVKWYEFGDFKICCVAEHVLHNPRGRWKWEGWQVIGESYMVSMYEAENVKYTGSEHFALGGYEIDGIAVLHGYWKTTEEQDAKDKANEFFRKCKGYALIG